MINLVYHIRKFTTRLKWRKEHFWIAHRGEGSVPSMKRVQGYVRKGIGVHQTFDNCWSVTHLGSGHNMFYIRNIGGLHVALLAGTDLSSAINWQFNKINDEKIKEAVFRVLRGVYAHYRNRGFAFTEIQDTSEACAESATVLNRGVMAI